MTTVKRVLQLFLEVLVAVLGAGAANGLLIPLLRYLDRMPAYPWSAAMIFAVLLAFVAATTLRRGGSLRRG